ncbi:MAG TPA: HDOD domain-containing protein [Bryobacteraceae bacterium]|nr:HDOD domain-containing protein [Bryobacteraceae bacterium]
MELLVARQPIFDEHLRVCAYELLFRSSRKNAFDGSEGNSATSKVISAVFGSADSERLLGGKRAFLNFPRTLLVEDAASVLPPRSTVIEILETVEPDAEVIEACARLRAQGYQLALDDFVPQKEAHPLIPLADFLKVDFRATTPAEQRSTAVRFGRQLRLLAEKVETREEFRRAAKQGYGYFQGYFFARPEILSARQIRGTKLNYLRILSELHHSELDFNKLTALLKREHALAYKLLKFVNSALFSCREPIESIHQALTFVGEEAARKWLLVVGLMDLTADRPAELAANTLLRARFSELLAERSGLRSRREDCFLMGMFSRLDAMLGRPLEDLLRELNLHDEIVRALLQQTKPGDRLAEIWKLVLAYEAADWKQVDPLAATLSIPMNVLGTSYTEAVSWADAICRQ